MNDMNDDLKYCSSPWLACLDAQDRLEKLGAKHAPIQRTIDDEGRQRYVDGRFVIISDPVGVYFILGTDRDTNLKEPEKKVQLIFHGVPDTSEHLLEMLSGWKIAEKKELHSDLGPIQSVFLEPE
jgi:hypothetical protein